MLHFIFWLPWNASKSFLASAYANYVWNNANRKNEMQVGREFLKIFVCSSEFHWTDDATLNIEKLNRFF